MRYRFENNMTINKLVFAGLLCIVFSTTGCVSNKSYLQEECEDGICTRDEEYTAVCYENEAGYSECNDETPVNYTQTAAQFRKYGERSPRDHRITQAAVGNNISATVIPSIENEVLDYETELGYDPNHPSMSVQQMVYSDTETTNTSSETSAEEDQDKDWLAEEGQSLKQLLTQWSEEAGWRLIWKTNRNYTLNAGAMFRGNFADVSSALVRAFARARPAPIATFYKGNRVLVIETMEDENAFD